MSTIEIQNLSSSEKLLILETIWQDFKDNYENSEIPEEHKSVLDERRHRAEIGDSEVLDWDSVKNSIGNHITRQ